MIELALLTARQTLLEQADGTFMETFHYSREHQIPHFVSGGVGAMAITKASVFPGARFDFAVGAEGAAEVLVFEAFGADDETVVDLVGWQREREDCPLSMFGRVGLLGLSAALNPATFFMGAALAVHETPLDWLRAGCRGSAIVAPDLAARQLRDLHGPIAAVSIAHGRRLRALIDSVARPSILVPERRAA